MKHYSTCLLPFRRLFPAFVLPVLLSAFVSCREELCYNHFGEAEVCFQWPGTSPSEPFFPEGVTMLVYGDDSDRPTENFISPTGGNVGFGSGKARSILVYNNDTENIRFFGFSLPTTAYATSTPAGRSVPAGVRRLHPDEPALNPPDILYAAYIESLPDLGSHEKLDLSFDMRKLVNDYEITYEFEYGGNRVVLARGWRRRSSCIMEPRPRAVPRCCMTVIWSDIMSVPRFPHSACRAIRATVRLCVLPPVTHCNWR